MDPQRRNVLIHCQGRLPKHGRSGARASGTDIVAVVPFDKFLHLHTGADALPIPPVPP